MYRKELKMETRKRDPFSGRFIERHGMKKTRLYYIWSSMKERCYNPHNKRYKNYGGRGISVCIEWVNSFIDFKDWAFGNGYEDNLTIDRIDNDGNYCPKNCRWITRKEQNRNYSRNHKITYNGETLCLADMADKYGVKRTTVLFRIKSGKPLDVVFSRKDFRYGK